MVDELSSVESHARTIPVRRVTAVNHSDCRVVERRLNIRRTRGERDRVVRDAPQPPVVVLPDELEARRGELFGRRHDLGVVVLLVLHEPVAVGHHVVERGRLQRPPTGVQRRRAGPVVDDDVVGAGVLVDRLHGDLVLLERRAALHVAGVVVRLRRVDSTPARRWRGTRPARGTERRRGRRAARRSSTAQRVTGDEASEPADDVEQQHRHEEDDERRDLHVVAGHHAQVGADHQHRRQRRAPPAARCAAAP